jgi:signal transduction histidine kinase
MSRTVRWAREHREGLEDGPVAFATTVIELALLVDGSPGVTLLGVLVTVVAGAALWFRRRAPLPVLAVTALLTLLLVLTGDYPGGAPVIVALFTVAELRDRWVSLAALVPTAVLLQAGAVSSVPTSVLGWALGVALQSRRRWTRALEERAEHLEREREQLDQLAVHRERAAVARELHDIVAHSVTVMLMGVRGARDVLNSAPDVADETLRQVEESGERSVAELRRILGVLRADGVSQGGAPVRPAPSLSELDDLVAGYRAAGLPVVLDRPGRWPALPAGTQLSVYRVVEEALTNVVRHANANAVSVRLTTSATALTVVVENDSSRAVPQSSVAGHGIIGMRERVASAGGHLTTGPLPDGGFRVRATFPASAAGDPGEASTSAPSVPEIDHVTRVPGVGAAQGWCR